MPENENETNPVMEAILVEAIPDFKELEDINKRQEEKGQKDVDNETVRLLTEKGIVATLQENADKIVSGEGIEIEIINGNMPRDMEISSIQSVTEYIFKQKGYDVVTKIQAGNSFSLSIKRIKE